MVSSFFERLFGLGDASAAAAAGMPGTLLDAADVAAWYRRHASSDVVHLAHVLFPLTDVKRVLGARGLHTEDVVAVITQLFDDVPQTDDDERRPARSTRLAMVAQAATRLNVMSTSRLVEALADALPRELDFARSPLRASAEELGRVFDARIAATGQTLTFEGWDEDLRKCFGLLQHLTDDRWPSWSMSPPTLFITMLCYKPYFASFSARGVDPKALVRDLGDSLPKGPPVRPRPKALTPSVSPALYAVVIRAERYAAEDATGVRLRHVLAALRDESELAPFVDRLAAS